MGGGGGREGEACRGHRTLTSDTSSAGNGSLRWGFPLLRFARITYDRVLVMTRHIFVATPNGPVYL